MIQKKRYKIIPFLILVYGGLTQIIKETDAVQVLSVDVPSRVKVGSQISLGCLFDLQGKSLYSLNWWKDHQQFYQFSPTATVNKQIHETYGIEVVVSESNLKIVTLRNVTIATSGEFKCEIVADYPSYERDTLSAPMKVIAVPKSAPVISVDRVHYRAGDIMKANCSSPISNPSPSLSWHINGKEIPPKTSRTVSANLEDNFVYLENSSHTRWKEKSYESESHKEDLKGRLVSEVFLVMKPIHFMHEGRAILTCVASIPNIYHSATSVQLTLPGIKPAEPSLHISNSQNNIPVFPLQLYCLIILIAISERFSFDSVKLHLIAHNYHLVS